MKDEIAAILPEWTIRVNHHWDNDVSYCLFRDGYQPFRLTDRTKHGTGVVKAKIIVDGQPSEYHLIRTGKELTGDSVFIVSSFPPNHSDLHKSYPTKEAALADLKLVAQSCTLFPVDPKDMLGLPTLSEIVANTVAPVSIKREGPLEKLTMIFGRDNEKVLAATRPFYKIGCYVFNFPENDFFPLHPSKHVDIIKDYIERFTICCIATHSEVMMLYVLREVAKKRLTPEQIDVIYVCEDGKEMKLRLDNEGDFIDRWPEGFFEERMELLFYEE